MEKIKCITNHKKNKASEINIVYITDRNYFPNTCISIYSIKKNRNPQLNYQVYVILDQVPMEETEVLYQLETDEFQIHLIRKEFDLCMFSRDDFPVSMSACIKFQLAEILPTLEKVLYLDGDIIVQTDLWELYISNIEDVYAAVVRDMIAENMRPSAMDKLKSDLRYYFNSGMMLLNLRKIREDGIQDKLIDYRLNDINYFMDQDALNMVFDEQVRYLPTRFNYLITMIDYADNIEFPDDYGYSTDSLEWERIHSADIVHLTGKNKPWKEYVSYATELFLSYYFDSPFKEIFHFKPLEKKFDLQVIPEKYIFPFGDIPKDSQIVIWGAGKIGQEFYRQVQATGFCRVVGVIDGCADQYNQDEKTWKGSYLVSTPEKLQDFKFDYIVVAVKREQIAQDIMKDIKTRCATNNEKLVWKYLVYS